MWRTWGGGCPLHLILIFRPAKPPPNLFLNEQQLINLIWLEYLHGQPSGLAHNLLNSPGRRPNGVYDRFPLGGFTLLYGSLLGSPPPTDFWQYKGNPCQTLREKVFWPPKKSLKKLTPQFSVLGVIFSISDSFSMNSEPFWINSGTPWASFFDVFWGYQFCYVFSAILQQISKIWKM